MQPGFRFTRIHDVDQSTPQVARRVTNVNKLRRELVGAGVPAGSHSERFWRSYLVLGFALLTAESGAVAAYLLRTLHGPNRPLLLAIAAGEAVVGVVAVALSGWVSRRAWRAPFSFVWSLAAVLLLAYCAHLDNGLDSPMLYLSALPVFYSSVALRTRWVAGVGLVTVGGILAVGITDADVKLPQESLLMFSAFVVGVIILAVLSAHHRETLQADEDAMADKLNELSLSDALTGCRNQRLFHERLAEEVDRANRHQRPLCLIVCDVDLFKEFNDFHGHDAGDAALASIGAHLRAHARSTDVVARIGGDEFALLLPETSAADAATTATRILTRPTSGRPLPVKLSLGRAGLDPLEPTARRLFRDADQAMYDAKALGRTGSIAAGAH
jgi:diguanylate cyclase (GGDEF)-like protein